MKPAKTYRGPDRRLNHMYVTQNTEYHCQGNLCIAVRDRRTGRWLLSHLAVGTDLGGAVRLSDGAVVPVLDRGPRMGDALFFSLDERELITSPLIGIERPPLEAVDSYSIIARRFAKTA